MHTHAGQGVLPLHPSRQHRPCLLFIEKGAGGSGREDFIGLGYRYLTVQIFDADHAIEDIVARGGRLAREAIGFRNVARYGFVKDPDGNWIEISAQTSLTGLTPKLA